MSTPNLPSPTAAASHDRSTTGRLRRAMLTGALGATVALGVVVPAPAGADGSAFGGPGAPSPAPGSAISHDVDVVVTSGGDLHIIGDERRNRIDIHGNGAGYAVWVHKANGQVVPHNLGSISGNVFVDLSGANDRIDIGIHGPVSFPGFLVVEGGAGGDRIRIENAEIGEELVLKPGTGDDGDVDLVNVTIGDDLRYDSGENTDFDMRSSTVEARMMVTTPGPNDWADVDVIDSQVGRLLAFTGARRDFIRSQGSDLGTDPVINLGDGDDGIWFNGANTWDGRLVAATGTGDDQIQAGVDTTTSGPPGVTPLGSVDIRMGADDDLLWIADGLVDGGAGSILRGGSGVDKLEAPGDATYAQASLSGWERFS